MKNSPTPWILSFSLFTPILVDTLDNIHIRKVKGNTYSAVWWVYGNDTPLCLLGIMMMKRGRKREREERKKNEREKMNERFPFLSSSSSRRSNNPSVPVINHSPFLPLLVTDYWCYNLLIPSLSLIPSFSYSVIILSLLFHRSTSLWHNVSITLPFPLSSIPSQIIFFPHSYSLSISLLKFFEGNFSVSLITSSVTHPLLSLLFPSLFSLPSSFLSSLSLSLF